MLSIHSSIAVSVFCLCSVLLTSCATSTTREEAMAEERQAAPPLPPPDYAERLPHAIETNGHNVVLVNPRVHAWGAYGSDGNLMRAGLATAGSDWCPDLGRPCHTKSGVFHVNSLGSPECKSTMFPIPRGGAPMPYCMFFNHNQAMHGSPEGEVVEGNISHGCVRMHISDAEWLRYNFVSVGTKVIVEPY